MKEVLIKLIDKLVDFKVLVLIFLVIGLLKFEQVLVLLQAFELCPK